MAKPTLYDVIASHITEFASNLYTALPAKVTKYDADKQTVNAKPTLNILDIDGVELPYPELRDVPVIFPSGGGGLLSFPIKKDDNVLIVFSKNSIDLWKTGDGKELALDSNRHHSLSDGIAIAGLHTHKNHLKPNPDDVELKFKDSRVTLKKSGDVEVETKGGIDVVAASDINITSESNVNIHSSGLTTVTSDTSVSITAPLVSING